MYTVAVSFPWCSTTLLVMTSFLLACSAATSTVLIIFLAAVSLYLPSAAIRKPFTTSLISLTTTFTTKHKSTVTVVVDLFLVTLPAWLMKSFHQLSVLVDKVSIILLFATVTHSRSAGFSPLLSRKVSLHILSACCLRAVIRTSWCRSPWHSLPW